MKGRAFLFSLAAGAGIGNGAAGMAFDRKKRSVPVGSGTV